jgi:hypothetical protein
LSIDGDAGLLPPSSDVAGASRGASSPADCMVIRVLYGLHELTC